MTYDSESMEKSLIEARAKYHVGLGDYRFSPIIEITTAITLDYCELTSKKSAENHVPLFFCFPEKKSASLWLSINLLTNFYLEEYIIDSDENIHLENGDMVDVYGSILKFWKKENKIILTSKDGVKIYFDSVNNKHLTKSKNRIANTYDHYIKSKRKLKTNRNPISKIFEPSEPIVINTNNLNSKILLIAGHGHTNSMRSLLRDVEIYDESLTKIFPENENVIIKPDLKSFKEVFSFDSDKLLNSFISALKRLEGITEIKKLKLKLYSLNQGLKQSSTITDKFNTEFESIVEEFIGLEPKLDFINKKYPGVQEGLPESLKAVIINDVSQMIEYNDTIHGFLKIGIPVVFISNRKPVETSEIEFYKNLFTHNPEYFRVNWNKRKILSFKQTIEPNFIDKDFWRQCIKYANQKIEIKISYGNELDLLMPNLSKEMRELDEFEILQTSFNRLFNPAYYALKNSNSSTPSIKELVNQFEETYDEFRKSGIDEHLLKTIELAILAAKLFDKNTKEYEKNSNVFTNTLVKQSELDLFIPIEMDSVSIPSSKDNLVIFSGFPYREYSGHYLWDSICLNFITSIKVLCWPNEAKLTESYIKRRLLAGYFTDNIKGVSSFISKDYLLDQNKDFENEINSFLVIGNNTAEEGGLLIDGDKQERNLEYLHALNYKGYSSDYQNNDFKVKCNIINFTNGHFLFLPKGNGGKVLSEIEDSYGKIRICELKFNKLTVGLKVYKYKKDRSTYKEIANRTKEVSKAFSKLNLWKDCLEKLYAKSERNVEKLEILLMATKFKERIDSGNPVRSNIQMWLFDEEKISPRADNLEIILRAAQVENIELILPAMEEAFNLINSFYKRLNSIIKKSIMQQISAQKLANGKLKVNLDGTDIEVESFTIMALESSDIEIDYRHTRKILC